MHAQGTLDGNKQLDSGQTNSAAVELAEVKLCAARVHLTNAAYRAKRQELPCKQDEEANVADGHWP